MSGRLDRYHIKLFYKYIVDISVIKKVFGLSINPKTTTNYRQNYYYNSGMSV